MSRGAIYTRVSRDLTGEGAAVARPEEDCRALAKSRGVEVLAVFSDNDTSAYSATPRPGYRALLAAVASGEVEVVLVWHTDRLYRRMPDLEEYISVCQPRGAPTLAVQAGPLDLATPSGRMVARTLGSVAQYESEQKAERQKRANFQRALQGRHSSTLRIFGYEPGGLELREDEAGAVADAYRSLLDGVPLAGICRRLNDGGFRTSKKSNLWDSTVLSQLLKSPRYAGYRVYHREILNGPDGKPVRGQWPTVVDEETWHAAQVILTDPSRRWAHPPQQLLSGVAKCAVCGAVIHSGGTRNGKRRYRCSTMAGHAYREAEPIDRFVESVVIEYLRRPDIAAALAPTGSTDDTTEILRGLASVQQRSDGLVLAYADGLISQQQLKEGQTRLERQRKELQARMPVPRGSILRRVVAAPDAAQLWTTLDVDERRQVIDELLTVEIIPVRTKEATYLDWRKRIVNPDSVSLTWKVPSS
ncbi:MAG: recombinase family protein [Propionibacteriaceae bacterium]|nr:recombinase family protein [Propionibacteriaceae bacterium]